MFFVFFVAALNPANNSYIVNIKKSGKLDKKKINNSNIRVKIWFWKYICSKKKKTSVVESHIVFLLLSGMHDQQVIYISPPLFSSSERCKKREVNGVFLQQETQHLLNVWRLKIRVKISSKPSGSLKKKKYFSVKIRRKKKKLALPSSHLYSTYSVLLFCFWSTNLKTHKDIKTTHTHTHFENCSTRTVKLMWCFSASARPGPCHLSVSTSAYCNGTMTQ